MKWCRKSALRRCASDSIGIPEVFDDTIEPGARTCSTRSNRFCLISSCSTTASMIQSLAEMRLRSCSNPPVVMRVAASRVKNGSGLRARARFKPSRAASGVTSSSTTGTPAFARWAAICAPIVPAPSTDADLMRFSFAMVGRERLVLLGFEQRLEDVRGLREDGFLEIRRVRHGRVERTHTTDRGVEILEQLAGDPGGDFRTEATRQLILM